MINAHVEMNLNEHISVIATHVLKILKKKNGECLAEVLMKEFLKKHENYTPDQFFDSLIFLYSLGFIDYCDYKIKVNYV